MEIQQHDGVVVEVAGSRQSFAKHYGGVGEGEGGNQRPRRSGMKSLLSPTIYRGAKGGGAQPRRSNLLWPAAKGRGLAPQAKGGANFRVPPPQP